MSDMTLRAYTVLLLLSSVLHFAISQYDECPPNEVYTQNVNPCNTCENKGFCPQEEGGCDCAPGTYRNAQGQCVQNCEQGVAPRSYGPLPPPPRPYKPAQPPRPRCGPNEEYTDCGTSCPPTCVRRNPVCHFQCVPGCFCRRGFVRAANGRCIPPQQCPPPPCAINEVYSDCGSACPATCENRQPICTFQCVRGCFCRTGYLKKNDGACVLPQECNPYKPYPPPPTPVYSNPPPVTPRPQDCPNRRKCAASCKRRGYITGFCVGEGWRTCSCRS